MDGKYRELGLTVMGIVLVEFSYAATRGDHERSTGRGSKKEVVWFR